MPQWGWLSRPCRCEDEEVPYLKDSITVTDGDTAGGKHPLGSARCEPDAEEAEDFLSKLMGTGRWALAMR